VSRKPLLSVATGSVPRSRVIHTHSPDVATTVLLDSWRWVERLVVMEWM